MTANSRLRHRGYDTVEEIHFSRLFRFLIRLFLYFDSEISIIKYIQDDPDLRGEFIRTPWLLLLRSTGLGRWITARGFMEVEPLVIDPARRDRTKFSHFLINSLLES